MFCFTVWFIGFQKPRFECKGQRGSYEENRDIKPVGTFAESAVYCIEQGRDKGKAEKDSDKLYAPEVFIGLEKEGLEDSEPKERKVEKFHMLEGGFVNA